MSRSAAGNRFPQELAVVVTLFLAVALLMTLASRVNAADDFKPTFAYEALSRDPDVLLPLLKVVCGEGVRTVTAQGGKALGCGDLDMQEILESRNRPRRYEWMPYVLWEADGVLFGHFLSAASEDAVIPCVDCETHPALWGGSLFLTKQDGKWEPVWYKPGVVTRHCHKVSLETGRQILFCEEPDGGMGHSLHGLYLVDFTKPKSNRRSGSTRTARPLQGAARRAQPESQRGPHPRARQAARFRSWVTPRRRFGTSAASGISGISYFVWPFPSG
jgi:hypothetical protein